MIFPLIIRWLKNLKFDIHKQFYIKYSILKKQKDLNNLHIMHTCPCNEYPLNPTLIKKKNGVCMGRCNFLIFALKHRLWVLGNMYQQCMF